MPANGDFISDLKTYSSETLHGSHDIFLFIGVTRDLAFTEIIPNNVCSHRLANKWKPLL